MVRECDVGAAPLWLDELGMHRFHLVRPLMVDRFGGTAAFGGVPVEAAGQADLFFSRSEYFEGVEVPQSRLLPRPESLDQHDRLRDPAPPARFAGVGGKVILGHHN